MEHAIKFVEIRDRATFISAVAFRVAPEDGYLARRAGYYSGSRGVCLVHLQQGFGFINPHDWPVNRGRSMTEAHKWLYDHFDEIEDHAVIDVEFILGESKSPKVSESEGHPE